MDEHVVAVELDERFRLVNTDTYEDSAKTQSAWDADDQRAAPIAQRPANRIVA